VGEEDAEREPDERADRKAGGRLLRGEQRPLDEHGDETRADAARRRAAPERGDDVAQVRHRRVVDDERPRPALAHPEPAIPLPEPPERREHDDEQRDAANDSLRDDGASLDW
jgi:hypothetical protein